MTQKKPPLLVYVAGPYRAATAFAREENIFEAKKVGAQLAAHGFMPVIPHANTAHFDGLGSDEFFLEGTLELMRRCDAVFLMPSWQRSSGARAEKAEAENMSIPCVESVEDLQRLLTEMEAADEKFEEAMTSLTDTIRQAFESAEVQVRVFDLNNDTDA